ncbi:hypothetical protein MKEN_00202600 [Mycena kentingensis (nom. inval.)]|nr:hypothetical protein MKEN_00202600 [Mycena kentingensis (nom. inval.)]
MSIHTRALRSGKVVDLPIPPPRPQRLAQSKNSRAPRDNTPEPQPAPVSLPAFPVSVSPPLTPAAPAAIMLPLLPASAPSLPVPSTSAEPSGTCVVSDVTTPEIQGTPTIQETPTNCHINPVGPAEANFRRLSLPSPVSHPSPSAIPASPRKLKTQRSVFSVSSCTIQMAPPSATNNQPMRVVNNGHKEAPTFEGDVFTLEFSHDAERAGLKYAKFAKIPAEDLSEVMADSFLGWRPKSFLSTIAASIPGMPWATLMDKMRDALLGDDWASSLRAKFSRRRMRDDETFADFANSIRSLNALLANRPEALSDDKMRSILEANVNMDLDAEMRENAESLENATTLEAWCLLVEKVDKKRRINNARLDRLLAQKEKENRRPRTSGGGSSKSFRGASNNNASSSAAAPNKSSQYPGPPIPPLDPSQRTRIIVNKGCLRCRLFYTDHIATQKVCPLPDPNNLPDISEEAAAAARAKFEAAEQQGKSKGKTKAVNVVYREASDSEEYNDDTSSELSFKAGSKLLKRPLSGPSNS